MVQTVPNVNSADVLCTPLVIRSDVEVSCVLVLGHAHETSTSEQMISGVPMCTCPYTNSIPATSILVKPLVARSPEVPVLVMMTQKSMVFSLPSSS